MDKKIKTTKIGEYIWMAENLNVSHFRNGDPILEAKTDEEWSKAGEESKPAWCYYENKISNGEKYGKLYNWYAVNDSRGLAPEGWYIPEIGMDGLLEDKSGNVRRLSPETDLWDSEYEAETIAFKDNTWDGNNKTGFSALPAGIRFVFGAFKEIEEETYFWGSYNLGERGSFISVSSTYERFMHYTGDDPGMHKRCGASVRCVKSK